MPSSKSRRIIFTVYKGVSLLDLAGPLEAFRVADAFSPARGRRTPYECIVVSSRGGRVMTADGVELNTRPLRSVTPVPGRAEKPRAVKQRAVKQPAVKQI